MLQQQRLARPCSGATLSREGMVHPGTCDSWLMHDHHQNPHNMVRAYSPGWKAFYSGRLQGAIGTAPAQPVKKTLWPATTRSAMLCCSADSGASSSTASCSSNKLASAHRCPGATTMKLLLPARLSHKESNAPRCPCAMWIASLLLMSVKVLIHDVFLQWGKRRCLQTATVLFCGSCRVHHLSPVSCLPRSTCGTKAAAADATGPRHAGRIHTVRFPFSEH